MQSLRQYRQIGRYIEARLHHCSEKGRSWSAADDLHVRSQRSSTDVDLEAARATSGSEKVEDQSERDASPDPLQVQHRDDGKVEVQSEGPDDPTNPLNWPLRTRCKNLMILFFLVFTQAWAGACDSQANKVASREFRVSRVAENLDTAMYLVGIGTGALFAGPLSEAYGRNVAYLVTTSCYLLFVLGTALVANFGGQVVCRFLVGLFAATTLTINGSSVSDQFGPLQRSIVFPIIAFPNIGGESGAGDWCV